MISLWGVLMTGFGLQVTWAEKPALTAAAPPTLISEPDNLEQMFINRAGPPPKPGLTPEATARQLYGCTEFYERGMFPRVLIDHLKGCFTPALSQQLSDLHSALELWKIRHAEDDLKLPLTEGSIFISSYEGCHNHKVGSAIIQGTRARVPVVMSYTENGRSYPWVDVAVLHRVGNNWLLDDILFDPARGGKNSLRTSLRIDFE